MKIPGITLSKLNEVVLVFERNGTDDKGNKPDNIVFRMNPVDSYEHFLEVCPEPKPAKKILPGGRVELDNESEDYLKARREWLSDQINYTLLVTMKGTPGLEWETIDMDKPSTWKNVVEELQQCLYDSEIMKLYEAASQVNNVTDASLEKARNRFLASERRTAQLLFSQTSAQESTLSGEPASDSESVLLDVKNPGTTPDGPTTPETSS